MHAFTELEIFVEVVRHGSFSAAARRLGLAPSVVADRVKGLEKRLGVPLLLRTTRRQALTEAGTAYFQEASRLLDEWQTLESRVVDSAASAHGILRVTAPTPLGRQWISPFIERFAGQYPEIGIHLTLDDRFADIVAEGFDVAVRGGPVVDTPLIGRRLFETRRVVVASPAYLARHGRPGSPDELAAHRCLVFNSEPHRHADWRFGQGAAARKLRVTGALVANHSELPVSWALAGLGLAQKSWWEVAGHLDAGRLLTVLDAFEPEPVAFYAIHPVSRSRSRKVALFVDALAAALADIDGGLATRLPVQN
ncbi:MULTISPECIES: LysR family transcriptional regulator [unclassified Burkholderia]|uniref:LysR family transcriptional regulator n=1 Tax=unclassified Burkholderia TaxID=2613784 RepID=UPI001423081A|nr:MULTISPECIES: LysR family transcriptional regulator [unclassified Burkholderia]NIE82887.1 LysR family transcriptional regulator [Burkholderia sp. Tr-860]NIF62329.1 LysR family transcriptional regulator [Burkholderia sp. Cy-647]NIF93722.1 LysR family transcriptional regulator [Burkholderia sp. Ax-1720]